MKFCSRNDDLMVILKYLDACSMLIIIKGEKNNLILEVGVAFLWDIHLQKRDGKFMKWKP